MNYVNNYMKKHTYKQTLYKQYLYQQTLYKQHMCKHTRIYTNNYMHKQYVNKQLHKQTLYNEKSFYGTIKKFASHDANYKTLPFSTFKNYMVYLVVMVLHHKSNSIFIKGR